MRFAVALLLLVLSTPALAQVGDCRGQADTLHRDLALNGSRLSATDRFQAEERLNRAGGLCLNDPRRATDDLEKLRRDMQQQSMLAHPPGVPPWTPPGTPGVPGR